VRCGACSQATGASSRRGGWRFDHRRDTIEEKLYTHESELLCWHYDHSKGRSVKGINLISALYHVEGAEGGAFPPGACVPVAFELVKKSEWIFDEKKHKWPRRSPETKNEAYRRMLSACKDRVG
jgi:hypothetical protein